ncbi:MAG: multiprotein bridging factor aMBF1 [Methanobrevibacter sp.]|jgi:putative transcription factor|nr:multiprotein bridging factor aMBF1 [Candidatus Methanovirga basalitermitum]
MRCEICGEVIENDRSLKTKIDGSVLDVCTNCSKFGKIQKVPPKPKTIISKGKPKSNDKKGVVKKTIKTISKDEPIDELVEDYNIIIKEKREFQGLSREQLASKISEKASVVGRAESGKMIPDIKLAKKFEKALKIILIEKIGEFDLKENLKSDDNEPTLGDIVKIKK